MAYNGLIHIIQCNPSDDNLPDTGSAFKGDNDRQYIIPGTLDKPPSELTDIFGIDFGFASGVESGTAKGGGHATPFPARVLMKVNHNLPLFLQGLRQNTRYNLWLFLIRETMNDDKNREEAYFKMHLLNAALHKMQILTGKLNAGEGIGTTSSKAAPGERTDMQEIVELSFTAQEYNFYYEQGTHKNTSGNTQGHFAYTKSK